MITNYSQMGEKQIQSSGITKSFSIPLVDGEITDFFMFFLSH